MVEFHLFFNLDGEDSDDPAQEYEFELWVKIPEQEWSYRAVNGKFTFEQQFQRLDAFLQGPPFAKAGLLLVENKIRKVGQQKWLSQTYPIILQVFNPLSNQEGNGEGNVLP